MITVLIVDDSPTIRTLFKALLEEDSDIRVVGQAENGREAVEMAHRLKPDLITMDVKMPVMNGLEATRRIMAENPTPIIIVTAETSVGELDVAFEALGAGALDVMAKPKGIVPELRDWENGFILKVKELSKIRPGNREFS